MNQSIKNAVFSVILVVLLLTSLVGMLTIAFAMLEWAYTPTQQDDALPPPSRVDLASELAPYIMFRPPVDTTLSDVAMPAEPGDESPPTIDINKHGFRYGPLNKEKPDDTLRIFMLGGSVVFYGHTNETTISGYLEQRLDEAYAPTDVQVVNAGVTGFISDQELTMLVTQVIEFQPDAVIVFDGFNDFLMPTAFEQRLGYPFKFKTLETAWYQSTVILRRVSQLNFLETTLAGSHFLRRFSPNWSYVNFLGEAEEMQARQEAPVPTPRAMAEHLIENWRKMARFLMAYQVSGLIILQPFNTNELPNAYAPQYDIVESVIPALNDEFAAANPPIRFASYRNRMDERMDLFWDQVHTYDEGNQIYADQMQRDLPPLTPSAAQ